MPALAGCWIGWSRWSKRSGGVPRILDVGTGTGVLALEALRRWPAATVFGADASSGMLGEARRRALLAGVDGEDRRLRWVHAPAETLPLPDGAVDVLVSSFTYQLVIDRSVAFHEALRVLRPGGALALVTWLDRGEDFAPAVEFDEAVYDVGIEEPEEPGGGAARRRFPKSARRRERAPSSRVSGCQRTGGGAGAHLDARGLSRVQAALRRGGAVRLARRAYRATAAGSCSRATGCAARVSVHLASRHRVRPGAAALRAGAARLNGRARRPPQPAGSA